MSVKYVLYRGRSTALSASPLSLEKGVHRAHAVELRSGCLVFPQIAKAHRALTQITTLIHHFVTTWTAGELCFWTRKRPFPKSGKGL